MDSGVDFWNRRCRKKRFACVVHIVYFEFQMIVTIKGGNIKTLALDKLQVIGFIRIFVNFVN